jgi:hypothetical protein
MGTPLVAMRPTRNSGSMDCKYRHFLVVGGEQWFTPTMIHCKPGYFPRAPGVCVKRDEAPPPPPPTCVGGGPGGTVGNPVQVASGAKVQTETDLVAGMNESLRVDRTYRRRPAGRTNEIGGPRAAVT